MDSYLDKMDMTTSETLEMEVEDEFDSYEMENFDEMEQNADSLMDPGYAWDAPGFENIQAWEWNQPADEFLGAHHSGTMDEGHDIKMRSIFPSKEEAYFCIRKYHILKMAQYRVHKSEPTFMVLTCFEGKSACPWRIRVSCTRGRNYWMVTKHNGEHTCNAHKMLKTNVHMNVQFVATEFVDKLREDLRLIPKHVQDDIRLKYGYDITYKKAWVAVRKCIDMVFGDWRESFAKLPNLLQAIQDTNPNTFVKWSRTSDGQGNAIVNRVFWAFGPAIAGYQHCRPVLSIDGTHLIGRFSGKLLVGVGLDANNQIFPLCFALVESESNSSWKWFMNCIREGVTQRMGLCVISDRHKGILNAMTEPQWSPPFAYHRYCIRHLMGNFYRKVKDAPLKQKMGSVGFADQRHKCDTEYRELLSMLSHRPDVVEWLENIDRSLWCLAYDEFGLRWGSMTTNQSESLNNVLKGARDLPISALVNFTFRQSNEYFQSRRDMFMDRDSSIAPKVASKLSILVQKAPHHRVRVFHRTNGLFEVTTARKHHKWTVNYNESNCTCGKWTIFHYPCSHALAVARDMRLSEEDLVDDYYKMNAYWATWSYCFFPIGDERFWRPTEGPPHIPNPTFIRTERGRPPTRRIRNEMDIPQFSQSASGNIVEHQPNHNAPLRAQRCKTCGSAGHNARTCNQGQSSGM